MAWMMVGVSLVPLVLWTAFKKKGSSLPACLASSSYFSRPDQRSKIRFSIKKKSIPSLVLPVACSRGSGMERSALRLEVTASPRLEVVDTSLERFLAKRDIVESGAV